MGVFGAMITAVSGLQAQSFALENISGNIANSQTTGFKRVDSQFVDLVTEAPARQSRSGSTLAFSRATNTIQGDLQTTGIGTNVALNGQGYFVVGERIGTNGDTPVFNDQTLYTRRGDFVLDKNGYLINGAGYYLKGATIDPQTGTTVTASTDLIKIPATQLSARQTTSVTLTANLPSTPQTNFYKTSTGAAQSELLQPSTFTTNPVTAGTVSADDTQDFLNQSSAAGSMTIYNDIGAPVNVQMRWVKVSDPQYLPDPTFGSADATWQLFYQSDSKATGTGVAWTRLGADFTFEASGKLKTPATSMVTSNVTVNGVPVNNVDFNFPNLTQFSDVNGQITNATIRQNGYSAGELQSVSVGADGRISGTYSNGQIAPLAQIAVVQFQADDALKRREGGVFEQTLESGQPVLGLQGSKLVGGALENSNTDIADEFSKMIITQQAYSANTRVITTAQQMLQDTINIIR